LGRFYTNFEIDRKINISEIAYPKSESQLIENDLIPPAFSGTDGRNENLKST